MKKLIATIGIILLVAVVADTKNVVADCVPPPGDLISWWSGDGNADDRMNNNPGTAINGTTYGEGKVLEAFSFDGIDDYVEVLDSPSLNIGTGDFSIEAWIRTDSTGILQTIMDKRVSSDYGGELGYHFTVPNYGLCFLLGNEYTYTNYPASAVGSSPILPVKM